MPFRNSSNSDFDFELQEELIGDRGNYVIHYISILCSCLQVDPAEGVVGHADPLCTLCFGQSRLFVDPVRMIGLTSGLSNNRMWAQVGWVEPGDLSFSPSLKARRISNFDKIVLTSSMPAENQVIVRGQTSPFSPRAIDLESNEDLLYWEAGRPEAVWLQDENGIIYHAGQYRLHGRRVKWAEGAGPAVGKRYSINYEAYPEYIAWVTPMDRWDRNMELGQRVMLKKAVMTLNPERREIRPPWEEQLMENGPSGTDDPYSKFGDMTSLMGEYIGSSR